MNIQEISSLLRNKFGDAILEVKIEGAVDPYVKVSPESWKEIAPFLKLDADLQFDFMMCLSGIDLGKGMLGAIYNIYSMDKHHKINVRIEVPREKPEVPSASLVWPGANWHEREAYDMVGIVFTGHPDLRRILMPYDWEGHPLRKDYKVPEYYKGIKVPY